MTRDTAAEPRTERVPVRIKVYGGGRSLLSPGTDWRVERITEHVAPSGLIGEVMPEWTLIDLSPLAIEAEAASGPAMTAEPRTENPWSKTGMPDHHATWQAGYVAGIAEVARLAPAAAEPAETLDVERLRKAVEHRAARSFDLRMSEEDLAAIAAEYEAGS